MDKIINIQVEEKEKEILGVTLSYQENNQRKKKRYSIYNPDIKAILENVRTMLSEELAGLEDQNIKYNNWKNLSKLGIFFLGVYFLLLFFGAIPIGLWNVLLAFIFMSPSFVAMSMDNDENVKREEKILEMLEKITKTEKFMKSKAISRVNIMRKAIEKVIQSAEKTTSIVRNFVASINEGKEYPEEYNRNSEELKKFEEDFKEEIRKQIREERGKYEEALKRLENLAYGGDENGRRKR